MTATRRLRPELLAPLLRTLVAQEISGEIRVRGTSMCPTLVPGDCLRVVAAMATDIRIGDVVIWMGGAGPVIHRLVGWWRTREGWRMLTKGDSCPRLDPPFPGHWLAARAVARVRGGEVQPLDGAWERLRGRGRAAASLTVGLIVEAWDRGRRLARRWAGSPGW